MTISDLKIYLTKLILEVNDRKVLEKINKVLLKNGAVQQNKTISYPVIPSSASQVEEDNIPFINIIDENYTSEDLIDHVSGKSADQQAAEKALKKARKKLEESRIKNEEKIKVLTRQYADMPKVDMSNFKFNREEANER